MLNLLKRAIAYLSKEFVDARRRVLTLQNAPQVLFRSDPPLELAGVPGLKDTGDGEISYVTFGKRHLFHVRLLLTIDSSFPSPSDTATPLREHLPHPDLP